MKRRGLGSDPKLHLEAWYEQEGQDVMIADGGLMCYRWEGSGTVWTGPAWVHPEHRRQGVMTRIVQRIACLPGVQVLKSRTDPQNDAVTNMYWKMGRGLPELDADGMYLWADDVDGLKARWGMDDV